MARHGAALLLCLVASLALMRPSAAVEETRDLGNLTSIKSCLPFNLLVYATDDPPQLQVDAPEDVAGALVAEVAEGELVLSLNADIALDGPAKVTVTVPFGLLASVTNRGAGLLLLDSLEVAELALTNEGSGRIVAWNVVVGSLTVTNNGVGGKSFVSGAVDDASLSAARGSIFLDGAEGPVVVEATNMFGTSVFTIKGNSDDVSITGKGTGTTKVVYDVGACDVDNGNRIASLKRSVCSKADTEELEEMSKMYEDLLLWTCSVTAVADEGCTAPIEEPTSESTSTAMGSGSPGGSQTSTAVAGADSNTDGMVTTGMNESEAGAGASNVDPKIPAACNAEDEDASMI